MASADDSVAIGPILGVAAVGFRLSLVFNAVGSEVANDGLEVHSIAKSITLFALTLKQAATVLQARSSVHSRSALDGVSTIASYARRIFDEFDDMLERVQAKPTDGSPMPSLQQRFKGCFKTHRVQYLLGQLDAYKLSLLLMLKVLQLGRLMASTWWPSDAHAEEQPQLDLINQERLEAQNVLVVRYWQMSKLSRLYEASQREGSGDRVTIRNAQNDDGKASSRSGPLHAEVVTALPGSATAAGQAEVPTYSLGELDQTLNQIKQSPRDMVKVSSEAIDVLLDRWTRWEEVQQRGHRRRDGGRHYAPSVDQLTDDDDDRQYYELYRERGISPKGVYLEGTTTDWRRPNSVAAMEEARRRRQKYKIYQPRVGSDVDDSPDQTASNKVKKAPRQHVIDSGSDSTASASGSASEDESPRSKAAPPPPPPVRRNSTSDKMRLHPERRPTGHHVVGGGGPSPPAMPRQALNRSLPVSPSRSQLGPSPQQQQQHPDASMSSQQRPDRRDFEATRRSKSATAAQQIHRQTNGAAHYQPAQAPYYPVATPNAGGHAHPPHKPMHYPYASTAQARYTPQAPVPAYAAHSPLPPRPSSQEGPAGRHPGRDSHLHVPHQHTPHSMSTGSVRSGHSRSPHSDKKQGTKQSLREGATKGILGAGAIAGFLEALEALDV